MARSPADVDVDVDALFRRRRRHACHADQDGGTITIAPEEEEEEQTWRVRRLEQVLATARHLCMTTTTTTTTPGSGDLDVLAEKLADGSRDVSWRVPIGDSGILDFFVAMISTEGLRQSLKIHALRLIGNSCADTDENRARLVRGGHLRSVIHLLSDDSTLAFVIPVLYNVCVDYEPAQKQASEACLSRALVDIISGPRLLECQTFLNIICKLLALLVSQDGEFNVANPATPTLLFHLAASTQYPPDLEDFCGLTSVALAYLTSEPFQVQLVSTRCFELLQLVFYHSLTRFHLATADPDHAAQLKQVWNVFVNMFADISALPVFPVLYPIRSPAVRRLVSWLANVPSSLAHLQTAACLALGNLSRSDESSRSLLADVYPPLCRILSQAVVNTSTPAAPSAQLLHAALSFLKNLAIPVVNKPVMGHLLEPPLSILPQIWSMTDTQPDTQFVAVSLTRLALTDCAANVARFCAPLSPDTSSPAHARSNVHKLIDLSQRADAEPTKIEAGRAIATVCRMLHTAPIDAVLPVGWDDYEIPDPASAQASTPIHLGYMSSPGSLPALSPSSASDSHSNNSRRSSSSHSSARPSATAAAAAADPLVQRRVRFYHAHAQMYKPLRGLLTQRAWPGVRSEALFVLALMSRTREGMDVGAAQAVSGPDALRALSEAVTGRDMIDGRELGGGGAAAARVAEQAGMLEGFGYSTAVSMMVGGGGGRPEAMEGVSREVGDMVQGLGLEPRQADPARSAGLRRVDRENGLVLVAEMLKQQGATMPSFQRNAFEEILAGGSEMVLGERSGLQA